MKFFQPSYLPSHMHRAYVDVTFNVSPRMLAQAVLYYYPPKKFQKEEVEHFSSIVNGLPEEDIESRVQTRLRYGGEDFFDNFGKDQGIDERWVALAEAIIRKKFNLED